MKLNQSILDAIRTQPENVECRSADNCIWLPLTEMQGMRLLGAINNYQWRIKPKPYEARHIVYLRETPKPEENSSGLISYLFGLNNDWMYRKWKDCTKKFEIIVREVVE